MSLQSWNKQIADGKITHRMPYRFRKAQKAHAKRIRYTQNRLERAARNSAAHSGAPRKQKEK